MTKETDPLGRVTTLAYDAVGRRTLKQDARGVRITYVYDDAGRLTNRQYPTDPPVTIAYDAAGNQTSIHDATGRTTMTYNAVNRLETIQGPTLKKLTYTYDAISQRKTLVAADAGTFTYTYDAANRLTVLQNPENERTSYTYDSANRVTFKELANATRASFTYDNGDRLTGLKNETNAGVLISRYTYTYDKVSNRLTADEGGGNLVTWTYDTTYRLTRERRSGSNTIDTTYAYDSVGNRTLKIATGSRTTTTYDAANQITTIIDSTGSTTMTYDAAGNLVEERSPTNQRTTHTWDDDNRQKKLQLPSLAVTTYTYRWDGLRYAKITASATKRFVFDGQNYLLETDSGNVLQAVMTNEPLDYGNLVSQRIKTGAASWSPIYYHYDALGSTRKMTNNSGSVQNTYVYNAWGESVSISELIGNRFRWVGQLGYYYDDDSDDYYIRARYYDPPSGRFASVDVVVIHEKQVYLYVNSNPMTGADPSGEKPPFWARWTCYVECASCGATLTAIGLSTCAIIWDCASERCAGIGEPPPLVRATPRNSFKLCMKDCIVTGLVANKVQIALAVAALASCDICIRTLYSVFGAKAGKK
jgi:RHS repeat-associated protein